MAGRQRNLEVKVVDPDPQATLQAALALGAHDQGEPAELVSHARIDLAGPQGSLYRRIPGADLV